MDDRKPRLLRALNALYDTRDALRVGSDRGNAAAAVRQDFSAALDAAIATEDGSPAVPWMNGPEDSWL